MDGAGEGVADAGGVGEGPLLFEEDGAGAGEWWGRG